MPSPKLGTDKANASKGKKTNQLQKSGGPIINNFTENVNKSGSKTSHRKSLCGSLVFDKKDISQEISHMGRCWRSYVTGEIFLNEKEMWPWFDIVDLWTRNRLRGLVKDIAEDPYLFVAIPMLYRTWIYHGKFEDKKNFTESVDPQTAIVTTTLQFPCIDAPVRAGRWSSLVFYAPTVVLQCLTGDMTLVTFSVLMMLVIWALTSKLNTPELYEYTRWATLLPRVCFLGFLAYRFVTLGASLVALPLIFAFIFIIADFIWGDFSSIYSVRMRCYFEIKRVLPNRIFVCKRIGGCGLDKISGNRGRVSTDVSGLGTWPSDYYLIADIKGILVELRPFGEDIVDAFWNYQAGFDNDMQRTNSCLSLNVFSLNMPSIKCLELRCHSERLEFCQQFKDKLPQKSLLFDNEKTEKAASPGPWKIPAQPSTPDAKNVVFESDL